MKFHVLTLFPEMIAECLGTSITGRAIADGKISINAVNIRDFSDDEKHHSVDDYVYGGGAGMLMQAQPVYDAYLSVANEATGRVRCIYTTPQGRVFDQNIAKELAEADELIFLCGHYEGIDQRVLDEIVTDNISIGDYVLTGGELPAMVMIDAISRMIPGVLHNSDSAGNDSFANGLLECEQYSRPEVWNGIRVPEILLSGDHAKVDEWRRKRSLIRTAELRPELLLKADLSPKEREFIENYLANKNNA